MEGFLRSEGDGESENAPENPGTADAVSDDVGAGVLVEELELPTSSTHPVSRPEDSDSIQDQEDDSSPGPGAIPEKGQAVELSGGPSVAGSQLPKPTAFATDTILQEGSGSDPIQEGSGSDQIQEGNGSDQIQEGNIYGTDPIQEGSDLIQEGSDPIQEGSNPIQEGSGSDPILEGSDPIQESSGSDQIHNGSDPIQEASGIDPIQEGSDPIQEASGNDPRQARESDPMDKASGGELVPEGEKVKTGERAGADKDETVPVSDVELEVKASSQLTEAHDEEDASVVCEANVEEDDILLLNNLQGNLEPAERTSVYNQGLKFVQRKKKDLALKCFLRCLTDLEDTSVFSYLPQCLRHVADIYYQQEEFAKAVQFIQAEKMYYETALIDTTQLQQQPVVTSPETECDASVGADMGEPDAKRAEEYERLAKLCLNKHQPQLALEYQAKATKLRQQVYGDNHEVTTKSLDFFTAVYGEVGKQQYSESMQKLSETSSPPDSVRMQQPDGLRNRKGGQNLGNTQKDKEIDEKLEKSRWKAETAAKRKADEEWISHALLWVLFAMCLTVLLVTMAYLYCKIDRGSSTCAHWRRELNYCYMRCKYLYYHYSTPAAKNTYA